MGNKVKISTKNDTAASSTKVTVLDTDYTKLWTGIIPVTGRDIEIDIGAVGEDGQPVWVYSHEDKITDAKIMGGFSYIIGEETPPQEEWVAKLNGSTQSWQLTSPIQLIADDVVELGFIGGTVSTPFAMFFESESRNFYISTTSDTLSFRVKATFGTPTLNGQLIDNNVTPIPPSGENVITAATVGGEVLSYIASRSGSSLFLNLAVYDFRIRRNGTIINEIPLTNRNQGSTQLATIGDVNAFMTDYAEDVWKNKNTL